MNLLRIYWISQNLVHTRLTPAWLINKASFWLWAWFLSSKIFSHNFVATYNLYSYPKISTTPLKCTKPTSFSATSKKINENISSTFFNPFSFLFKNSFSFSDWEEKKASKQRQEEPVVLLPFSRYSHGKKGKNSPDTFHIVWYVSTWCRILYLPRKFMSKLHKKNFLSPPEDVWMCRRMINKWNVFFDIFNVGNLIHT